MTETSNPSQAAHGADQQQRSFPSPEQEDLRQLLEGRFQEAHQQFLAVWDGPDMGSQVRQATLYLRQLFSTRHDDGPYIEYIPLTIAAIQKLVESEVLDWSRIDRYSGDKAFQVRASLKKAMNQGILTVYHHRSTSSVPGTKIWVPPTLLKLLVDNPQMRTLTNSDEATQACSMVLLVEGRETDQLVSASTHLMVRRQTELRAQVFIDKIEKLANTASLRKNQHDSVVSTIEGVASLLQLQLTTLQTSMVCGVEEHSDPQSLTRPVENFSDKFAYVAQATLDPTTLDSFLACKAKQALLSGISLGGMHLARLTQHISEKLPEKLRLSTSTLYFPNCAGVFGFDNFIPGEPASIQHWLAFRRSPWGLVPVQVHNETEDSKATIVDHLQFATSIRYCSDILTGTEQELEEPQSRFARAEHCILLKDKVDVVDQDGLLISGGTRPESLSFLLYNASSLLVSKVILETAVDPQQFMDLLKTFLGPEKSAQLVFRGSTVLPIFLRNTELLKFSVQLCLALCDMEEETLSQQGPAWERQRLQQCQVALQEELLTIQQEEEYQQQLRMEWRSLEAGHQQKLQTRQGKKKKNRSVVTQGKATDSQLSPSTERLAVPTIRAEDAAVIGKLKQQLRELRKASWQERQKEIFNFVGNLMDLVQPEQIVKKGSHRTIHTPWGPLVMVEPHGGRESMSRMGIKRILNTAETVLDAAAPANSNSI